ncbi:unnamed protein product, partial [Phaeothamnion confervicola]
MLRTVIGATFAAAAGAPGTDVLIVAHAPWCEECVALEPTLAMLARVFQAENRFLVGRVDHAVNDLPSSVAVESYPALLWFPAADKPYTDPMRPVPRPFAGEGLSLHQLAAFVVEHSSFSPETLRAATPAQLFSVLTEEEAALREAAEAAAHRRRRNERRRRHGSRVLDWAVGEVVYDGKRWHAAAGGLL